MLLSMTGFGKGEVTSGNKTVSVEIRSLNGKTVDFRIKSPLSLGYKELDLRKRIQESAIRGKIDMTIDIHGNPLGDAGISNGETVRTCFTALKDTFVDIPISDDAIFQAVLRLPNVMQSSNGALTEEEWKAISDASAVALERLKDYRIAEGRILHHDLSERINEILELLDVVDSEESARQNAFRDRLTQKMSELVKEGLDQNRLEQEMLYYMDKLDVNEEKVRLKQHCLYFLEVMSSEEPIKGKKLTFISQEIGREMNTLGAKAQWTSIQHSVVTMKNALEEIKEQLANIL